jgi:hypothetical protein
MLARRRPVQGCPSSGREGGPEHGKALYDGNSYLIFKVVSEILVKTVFLIIAVVGAIV